LAVLRLLRTTEGDRSRGGWYCLAGRPQRRRQFRRPPVQRCLIRDLRGITLEKSDQILGSVMPGKSAMRAQPAGRAAKARSRLDGRQRRVGYTTVCNQ
jgi:hypothetical protein